MQWDDTGFVLAARRHGEHGLIAEVLTCEHGRHLGFVRGGQSPRLRALWQTGNEVAAHWQGRLPEHLGNFGCELVRAHAARFLDDALRLAALAAASALAAALPEREPHADLFAAFGRLLGALDSRADWPQCYVSWECELLAGLGFGLDLGRCAVTGATEDLAYVSPKSGRAVSRAAGLPYHDKLLPLPAFLWRGVGAGRDELAAGLRLTGYFLQRHVFAPQGRPLPEARSFFADRLCRRAAAAMVGAEEGHE